MFSLSVNNLMVAAEAIRAATANGPFLPSSLASPVLDDLQFGLNQIARLPQQPAARMLEQLVVEKIAGGSLPSA